MMNTQMSRHSSGLSSARPAAGESSKAGHKSGPNRQSERGSETDSRSEVRSELHNFSAAYETEWAPSITASHYTLDEVLHLAAHREQHEVEFPDKMKPNRMLLLDVVNRDAGIMTMLERIKDAQRVEQRDTRNPNKRRRFSNINSNVTGRNSRSSRGPLVNRITFDGVERTITLSQPRKYIFSTTSFGHRLWQLLVAIASVCSGIFVPVLSCGLLDKKVGTASALASIETCCDLMFMVDVIVNFRTSYEDQVRDFFVTSPRHIAERYACSWLIVDLLYALPISHLMSVAFGDELQEWERHTLFGLRMLKTLRLLRLMFPRYPSINRLNSVIHPASLVLCRLIIDLSFVWHITACVYIYTCSIGYNEVLKTTEADFYFQNDTPWLPPPAVLNSTEALYIFSVWWAVGVSCSIHRPEPQTYVQLVFSLCITVAGIFLMTLLIGSLTTAIAEIQSINNQTTYKLQIIARYIHAKKLPPDLCARILSYYRFLLLSMNLLDESSVLPGLPRALRMQVSFMIHEPGFVKLSMFWVLKAEEIYFLCQRLKPCILLILDQIIKEGRIGIGLCIIEKGQVEVTRRGDFITLLPDSTAFGEKALEGKPSNVTVRASRYCELAILLTSDYHDLCMLNPTFAKYLKLYVEERDSKHLNPDMKAMALKAVIASSRTKIVHGWTQPANDMENMIAWQRAAHRTKVANNVVDTVREVVSRASSRRAKLPTSTKLHSGSAQRQPSRTRFSKGTVRNIVDTMTRDTTRTGRLKGVRARRKVQEWSNKSDDGDPEDAAIEPTASSKPKCKSTLKHQTSFAECPLQLQKCDATQSSPHGPLTRKDSQRLSRNSSQVPKASSLPPPTKSSTSYNL